MKKNEIIYAVILIVAIFSYAGYSTYQDVKNSAGPNQPADWRNYTNNEYGFSITMPDSWKGYSVAEQNWVGHVIDSYQQTYSGPQIIIKNPQTTSIQQWQDIPIMVFTKEQWNLVSDPNPIFAVSAAPMGPAKIGENAKYVFATPPRWYGFTDAVGWQEAVEIVKTFKVF